MYLCIKSEELNKFPQGEYEINQENGLMEPKLIKAPLFSYKILGYNLIHQAQLIKVLGNLDEFNKSGIIESSELNTELFYCHKTNTLKSVRTIITEDIVVKVEDKTFDGDEISQTRMVRALLGLGDNEVIGWKLADNTFANVSKLELAQALRLAGEEQTKIWLKY